MNLRALTPLFSSLEEGFTYLSSNLKSAFWRIGKAILEKSLPGTVFDPKTTCHASDSEEDNFDAVLDTAEKLRSNFTNALNPRDLSSVPVNPPWFFFHMAIRRLVHHRCVSPPSF